MSLSASTTIVSLAKEQVRNSVSNLHLCVNQLSQLDKAVEAFVKQERVSLTFGALKSEYYITKIDTEYEQLILKSTRGNTVIKCIRDLA